MRSIKPKSALISLGRDVRAARLRRNLARAELALRAGTSPSTIVRLESGDPGVGIGRLADVLAALGLIERLADLIDLRHDELGHALVAEQSSLNGHTLVAKRRRRKRKKHQTKSQSGTSLNAGN